MTRLRKLRYKPWKHGWVKPTDSDLFLAEYNYRTGTLTKMEAMRVFAGREAWWRRLFRWLRRLVRR